MKRKLKMKMRGGELNPIITKKQVLEDPIIKEALKVYVQSGSGRQVGGSWWDDFVSFLKKNKVISTGSKIGSIIATATGNLPLAGALGGISGVAGTMGYGRKMRGGMIAQTVAMPSYSSPTPYLKF